MRNPANVCTWCGVEIIRVRVSSTRFTWSHLGGHSGDYIYCENGRGHQAKLDKERPQHILPGTRLLRGTASGGPR